MVAISIRPSLTLPLVEEQLFLSADLVVGAAPSLDLTVSLKPIYTVDQVANYIAHSYDGDGKALSFDQDTISFNVAGLTAPAQALARAAIATWQDVANLAFVETTGKALITFDDRSNGAHTGSAASGNTLKSSDVNIGADWLAKYGTGIDSYSYQTFIHEIGHALGLGHAGPYDGKAVYGDDNDYANDTWQFTVMSYFDQSNYDGASRRYVMTPQVADIVAMATLYGAATATRTGDTTYGFKSNAGSLFDFAAYAQAPAFTIYDNGGVDTINASGYTTAQRIDLAPESFSNIGGLVRNIAIARNATIEVAVGGAGNDTLLGNAADNILDGGAGNDVMRGGLGNDGYVVSQAGDTIAELAGQGTDTVISALSYSLAANFENLVLSGNAALNGTGNAQANILIGNGAANRLDGGGGADTLRGGAGNDSYVVDQAGDVVTELAQQGRDVVYSSVSLALAANVEDLVLTGAANLDGVGNGLANRLTGNGGSNTLSGGGGADILTGGGGRDLFHFVAGGANGDQVTDFAGNGAQAGDVLYFQGYGTLAAGARFAQLDATHWRVSSADGNIRETLTLGNGPTVHAGDYVFA